MFSAKKSNIYHFLSILFIVFGSLIFGMVQAGGVTISTMSSLVFSQVGLVFVPVLLYFLSQKGSLKNSLYLKNPGFVNLAMSALLVFLLIPTVSLLNLLSMFFVRNQIADTVASLTDSPYFLVLLVLAVCPGVFEELSTRFILLNNYRHKPYYVACIFSGLFFGMLHMNINQFIYAFVLGAIFAFVVQITESIYTSMLMHIVLNSTTFSLSYFMSSSLTDGNLAEMANAAPGLNDVLALLGVNAITIPLAIFVLLFLIRYNGKRSILKQKPTVLELTLGRKLNAYAAQPLPPAFTGSPSQSGQPVSPAFGGAPVQPIFTGNPSQSGQPVSPAFGSAPVQTAQPAFTGNPSQSGQPVSPAFGGAPMQPAQPIFSGALHQVQPDSFYETDSSSPFNWAFWSTVILFVVLTFLNEFAARMMK